MMIVLIHHMSVDILLYLVVQEVNRFCCMIIDHQVCITSKIVKSESLWVFMVLGRKLCMQGSLNELTMCPTIVVLTHE